MKITDIEVINLRFSYPNEHGFRYGGGVCTARLTSLVLVHTDAGLTGLGSAYSHPGLVYTVVESLKPLLIGRDASQVEELWEMMTGLTLWFGRKGAAVSAIGGIDIALWDLRGKALGQPLWRLFDGTRDGCPAYASGLLWDEPETMAKEATRHREAGFKRMKMRLGQGERRDSEAVRAVRATIGPEPDLMVDAGMRLSPAAAARLAQLFEEQRVLWFEEPFAPDALSLYRQLRGATTVNLAAGENEFGVAGFRQMMQEGAVDIVQPDACRAGGITPVREIARMAVERDLQVATHTWSDAIALVANAHIVASCPVGLTVEVDRTGNPFIDRLTTEPLRIKDGWLELGEAPGLGIELNPAVVEELRLANALSIPDGNYSDMVWGERYYSPAGPYLEESAL